MRKLSIALASVVVSCAALAGSPARAAVTEIVAAPGSLTVHSYTTPVVIAPVGGPLTFLNQDLQAHSVVSDAFGPSTQPWCGVFEAGKCPLIWAPVTDAGGRTSIVRGLENAVSGTTYLLHCVIHADMQGKLITL